MKANLVRSARTLVPDPWHRYHGSILLENLQLMYDVHAVEEVSDMSLSRLVIYPWQAPLALVTRRETNHCLYFAGQRQTNSKPRPGSGCVTVNTPVD